MNVIELLTDLQAQHDKTAARAGELRNQIGHLTATLAETEARLADLATTRKVITELAPVGGDPEPAEPSTAYQAIVSAFNQHPDQAFRARELHELLGMLTTRRPSTSPAAGSDASSAKASSPNPDEAATRNLTSTQRWRKRAALDRRSRWM